MVTDTILVCRRLEEKIALKLVSSQLIHPRGPVKSRTKKEQLEDEYSEAKEGVVLHERHVCIVGVTCFIINGCRPTILN